MNKNNDELNCEASQPVTDTSADEKTDTTEGAAAEGISAPAENTNNKIIGKPFIKKEVIQKLKTWGKYPLQLLILCVGSCLYAAGLKTFLIPNQVIDGGVVGISIMASYLSGLPFSFFMVVLNIPFLYIGYKHMGKTFSISTIIAIGMLSLWSIRLGRKCFVYSG